MSQNLSRGGSKSLLKPKIIVILGPTASGKSELAVKIAKKFNGEVISADSRQIYLGLDIGSGKVPRDKTKSYKLKAKSYFYKGIPHRLLDVASPKRTFTVAQYQELAKKALKEIIKRGKIPIICGGTGLYIDALIYDYQFPKVAPQPKLRKQLEKESTEELFKLLKKFDPRRAKNIDKNNRRRLIRALEIVIKSGKKVPILKSEPKYEALTIGIKRNSKELKKLIKTRLLKRLKQGLVKEVINLKKSGLSWKRLEDFGLEYRYVAYYLQNKLSYNEMVEKLQKEIEHYSKRQMTWFKRDKKIIWIDDPKKAVAICRDWLGP